jgi:hypothetical protein
LQQSLDIVFAKARERLWLELGERRAEALALAQDRQPGQPGLEPLEADALEQGALVGDRPSPLAVVVLRVQGVAAAEAAERIGHAAVSAGTRSATPSTTWDGR